MQCIVVYCYKYSCAAYDCFCTAGMHIEYNMDEKGHTVFSIARTVRKSQIESFSQLSELSFFLVFI